VPRNLTNCRNIDIAVYSCSSFHNACTNSFSNYTTKHSNSSTYSQALPFHTRSHGTEQLNPNLLGTALTDIQVKEGDSIPDIDLFEDSPGNKVNLAKELASGKGLIIGVPAAFSPSCSDTHIPGYIASDKLKSAGKVFVVSVNDAFV